MDVEMTSKPKQGGEDGKSDEEYVAYLVNDARNKLKAYLECKSASERNKAMQKIGLNEGLAFFLAVASLDIDCQGHMQPAQMKKFSEQSGKAIETYLNALTNTGVVSALVLSAIFPLAYDEGVQHGAGVFRYFEYIFIQCALAGSITTVFGSAGLYTHLSFYLPTSRLRVWYIEKINMLQIMPCLEGLKNCSLIAMILALFSRQLHKTFFPLSLVSAVPVVLLLVALSMWGYANLQIITPALFQCATSVIEPKITGGNADVNNWARGGPNEHGTVFEQT